MSPFIVAATGTVHCFESEATHGGNAMLRVGTKAAGRRPPARRRRAQRIPSMTAGGAMPADKPTPIAPKRPTPLSFRLKVVIFYAANTEHARLDVDEFAHKFNIRPGGVKYRVKPLVAAGLLRPVRRVVKQGRRLVEYVAGDSLLRELGEID